MSTMEGQIFADSKSSPAAIARSPRISDIRHPSSSRHSPSFLKMLIVGLTGGIATGKSTVSKLLQEKYQLPIIDADILARKAVEPGTRAFKRILSTFGEDLAIRDSSGNITGFDRPALGRRVFGNEVARKKLNRIVHPAVRWLMVKAVLWEWLVRGRKVV